MDDKLLSRYPWHNANKLASLEATLVRNYHPTTHSLTGVKCRATSVAKKVRPGDTRLCLVFRPCQSRTLGLSPVDKWSSLTLLLFNIAVDNAQRSTVVSG